MSDSSVAFTAKLLSEEPPRSARCGGKAFVFFALILGLGFAALVSNQTVKEPAIDMAWRSMQARSMQPAKLMSAMQPSKNLPLMQPARLPGQLSQRNAALNALPTNAALNALRNPSALTGSGMSRSPMTDVRDILRYSPIQKCVYADKHASVCGNLVVLRPSTALRASSDKNSQTVDADQLIKNVADKWDAIEDKTSATLYAGGALVALVFLNNILAAVDAIPLLPGLMETVGLGYSSWFVYRYLLDKNSREELKQDIDKVKQKITGS
jgi:hypothetical protein